MRVPRLLLSEEFFVIAALDCLVLSGLFVLARRTCRLSYSLPSWAWVKIPVISLRCSITILIRVSDWNLGNDLTRARAQLPTTASLGFSFLQRLDSNLLSFLLMSQNLFFVLLEGHKVEVKILNAVLFKQILSDQTVEVDTSFCQSVVFIEGWVSLDCTEVAPVIAHVQWLLLVATQWVASQGVWDSATSTRVSSCRVVINSCCRHSTLWKRISGTLRMHFAILHLHVVIWVWSHALVIRARSCILPSHLWSVICLTVHWLCVKQENLSVVYSLVHLVHAPAASFIAVMLVLSVCNVWHLLDTALR